MGNTRDLSIVLRLRDQVSQELGQVEGRLQQMKPTFQKMAIAGTAAFAGISAGIFKATQAAGRAQDISALFNLAFQDTEDRMNAFVDEFADEFGRARTAIMQMASDMGFALSMGTDLASDSIADMTTELVFAAEALALADARIDDGEQAMRAFSDAMNGSMQQARRYIPTLREANVVTKAQEMGLVAVGEELTQTQRAMALYELIMEGTVMSQQRLLEAEGDYTDAKARFNAVLQDTMELLGKEFLPLATQVLEAIVPIIRRMGEWIEENPKLARNIALASAAVAGLVAIIGTLGLILIAVKPAIIAIGVVIGGLSLPILAIIGLIGVIGATLAYLVINWRQHWDNIKWATSKVLDYLKGIFKSASEAIMGFLNPIINTAQRAINLARQARDLAGGAIGGARDRIGGAISRVTPFADGGIVTQPTLGLVGEAGPEAIIPLNRQSGLGNTYNIIFKGNSFMGEDDLAEQVGDKLMDVIKQTTKISYGN